MELFKLWGSIIIRDEDAQKSLSKTEKKAESLGSKFGKIAGAVGKFGAALGGAATVTGGALAALTGKALETTSEINKFAEVTGHSRKAFQQWDSVMKSVGYSMEQASGDIAALGEKAMDAANGVGEGAELFGKLGVQVTDTSGKLKSQEQIFQETITALQGMENATERNAVASALLSTTGEELVPILNMTGEELANMKANANVISDDDLNKAAQFKESWDKAKNTLTNVFTTLGVQLMPMFQKLLEWVQGHMPEIQATFKTVFGVISTVITTVWAFIKDNVIPIFTDMFDNVQGNFPTIKETFETVFNAIWEVAKNVYEFLKDNVLPIYVELFEWVQGHMPTIKETFTTVFEKIKEVANMVWTFFKNNILPILERFYGYIQSKMPLIQNIVETVFGIFYNVVNIVWDIFENFLLPVLKALWEFIEPTFPLIQSAVETTFDAIFWAVDKVVGVFEGLVDIVSSAVNWLSKWNNTDVEEKSTTVHTNYTSSGGSITGGIPKYQYASGTDFHPGGMALVGEEGPELVNLPRGSSVKTFEETKDILGGNIIYATVNVASKDFDDMKKVVAVFDSLKQTTRQYGY